MKTENFVTKLPRKSKTLSRGRLMKKLLRWPRSKSSSGKLENLRKYLLLEPRVSILLKLVAMVFSRRCPSPSCVRELNSTDVSWSKMSRRRDRITYLLKPKPM